MGYRKFTDRDGQAWEVRDSSPSSWDFVPAPGNPGDRITVRAPGYEKDPFELSNEELQRMFDAAGRSGSRKRRSPFGD